MADFIREHKRGLIFALGIASLVLVLCMFTLVYLVPHLTLGSR